LTGKQEKDHHNNANKDLYAGGKDFLENPAEFETIGEPCLGKI